MLCYVYSYCDDIIQMSSSTITANYVNPMLTISKSTAAVTAIQCSLISKAALREKLPW